VSWRQRSRTLGPDVDVAAGVSGDGVSVLGERHAQHVLGLVVFLVDGRRDTLMRDAVKTCSYSNTFHDILLCGTRSRNVLE